MHRLLREVFAGLAGFAKGWEALPDSCCAEHRGQRLFWEARFVDPLRVADRLKPSIVGAGTDLCDACNGVYRMSLASKAPAMTAPPCA
jgi:hypothetical protein